MKRKSSAPPEVEWIKGIRVPTLATLNKHGHTQRTWLTIAEAQDFRCALCGKKPPSGILHIDHEHVKGYSREPYKLKRELRAQYTRGLLCEFCNRRILTKFHTLERTRAVLRYLKAYLERKKK